MLGSTTFTYDIGAGDPDLEATRQLALAFDQAGVDVLELGVPFSDPLADGPVIQRASERALARGMRTARCLDCLAATRGQIGETPIVPMTLEQAMAYIQDDELVEVTPLNIRLRKRALKPHERKRAKQARVSLRSIFDQGGIHAQSFAREAKTIYSD